MDIKGFFGEFRFLSNFWPAEVTLDGDQYNSVEHAYQAAKTTDLEIRAQIRAIENPGKVKSFSKKIELRLDWEDIKLSVMQDLLEQKFQIPELRDLLLSTGSNYLEETNTWGDTFWGVCRGSGQNNLGRILMEIRAKLKEGRDASSERKT